MHERILRDRNDAGFSMVEIVVAMLLFALLSVAVIPLILGITSLTAKNRDLEAARDAVAADIAQLREDYPTDPGLTTAKNCSVINNAAFADAHGDIGGGLEITRTTDACPADASKFPASLGVRYEVRPAGGGDSVSTYYTSIRVTQ